MITSDERDRNIIAHILEYCKQIDECFLRFGNSHDVFVSDVIFRNAVSMAEFQIGELAGHLSEDFKENTKNKIPWKEIRGMRNIFAHNYLEMDIERIWEVAAEDISALKEFCENQLCELPNIEAQGIDEDSKKFIKMVDEIAEWTKEAHAKAIERLAEHEESDKNNRER